MPPEEELSSCSHLHGIKFRKPQPSLSLRGGSDSKSCVPQCPQVPACPQLDTASIPWTVGERSQDSSGWGSCFLCVDVQCMLQLPTETSCTVLGHDFPLHTRTDRHGAFQLFDDHCQSFPVLRTDGAAWCPHKAMTSPCPARHPLPPRSVPSSPLRSQQTTTALGCNLLALTVVWSRLGTAGILGAGVLWCPAGTRVGWEC